VSNEHCAFFFLGGVSPVFGGFKNKNVKKWGFLGAFLKY
jgi:hypothetical protein